MEDKSVLCSQKAFDSGISGDRKAGVVGVCICTLICSALYPNLPDSRVGFTELRPHL